MKNGFRQAVLASALTFAVAGTASAGPLVDKGISFDATYSGNLLTLTVEAVGKLTGNMEKATHLKGFEFKLANKTLIDDITVTQVNPGSAPGTWSDCKATKNDAFCVINSGLLELTSPLTFTFAFTAADLDLSQFTAYGNFFRGNGSGDTTLLTMNMTAEEVAIDQPAEVPEPASLALLGLGALGLAGFTRRKSKRA